jgi:predicted kinase
MRELLKFGSLKERDCATVAECYRVLSPLASRCLALLGCAVTLDGATVRKDHVTSVMSRATAHGAAFSACRIPAFIEGTEGSAGLVEYKSASLVQVSSQPVRS